MGPLGMRVRSEFRGRWRSWLGLVLLIGVFGGATLATVAASRRTNTAYPRFLKATNPFDQFLLTGFLGEAFAGNVDENTVRPIPQVREVIKSYFVSTTSTSTTPTGDVIASEDPRLDRTYNRAKVIQGHMADPNAADEAMVPVAIATRLHARVGKEITIDFLPAQGTDVGLEVTTTHAKPIPMTFRVVAIIAEAGEFPPESDLGPPRIHLTPGFIRANAKRVALGPYILVWFHHGIADLPAFRKELIKRFGNKPVIGYTQSALTKNVERSFHLQAVSLELFAAALAIVTMLVLGQTLGRQASAEAIDYPSLRALGMTPRQLVRLGFVRAGSIAAAGALIALPVAYLFSPLAPTGLARAAEPTPGFSFDAVALGIGAAAVIALLLLIAIVPIVRASRVREERDGAEITERVSRSAAAAARAGVSVPALVGVRLALEPGRGRTSVPVRTTIAGVALAVGAVVLSLVFGASLRHLLDTPRLYGVRWSSGAAFDDDDTTNQRSAKALAAAKADPDVTAAGYSGLGVPLLINGVVQADAMMLPGNDHTFAPPLQAGRYPAGRTEIVLGPKTLQRLHQRVGGTITVGTVGTAGRHMTIVGEAVVPPVGHTANLGDGAYISFDAVGVFVPGATAEVLPRDEFLVRYRPGVATAKADARLQKLVQPFGGNVHQPEQPADLLNFGRNKNLPYVLSGMLAALALATLAHAMFTAINRRRRDLAILKTLGFTRIDTGKAVAWQSTVFVAIALAIGIVGGAAVGKWLWNVYANGLGVVAEPRVPALVLVAIAPIGIVIANALALIPGRVAARTRPALVLRTE